jgi:hypothetical protein
VERVRNLLNEQCCAYRSTVSEVASPGLRHRNCGRQHADCVGTESEYHRNIEVDNVSHRGMLHGPEVLRVVAKLLAEPRGGSCCTVLDTC